MPNISFDNTQIAFAYKSNKQLKKAKFLISHLKPQTLQLNITSRSPFAKIDIFRQ